MKHALSPILPLLRPYRGTLLLSLLFSAAYAGLSIATPLFFGQAIDAIAGVGQVDFALLQSRLITAGALTGVTALGAYLASRANARLVTGLTKDLRQDLFRHLQTLPIAYLDSHPYGDTLARFTSDVDQFADGLQLFLTQFFSGMLTILGTLGVLLALQPVVAAAVFVLTPLSLFVSRFITKRTKKYFVQRTQKRGALTAATEQTVRGLPAVRAYGREDAENEAFRRLNDALAASTLKAVFYSSITNPATRFVNSLVYAAVALTGAFGVLGGSLSVGLLVTVLGYANQYAKPFNEISAVLAELQNALTGAGRALELLQAPSEAPDPEQPVTHDPVEGAVAFSHVDFSYDKSRPLIRDLSLAAEPGQTVALVGTTGCGKTTLLNLLLRFYDPDGGQITLDGENIAAMTRVSLRQNVGLVLQETWLKTGTVTENLTFGRPDATMDEVVAAAKRTRADAFIRRLPAGYDTVIGDGGGSLSEGQKQLLCITRVLLADPNILILDEATSNIDLATEIAVQKALRELTKGRTCFIVAHRLSTVMHADVIAVMDKGRIVETGDHETLLAKNGAYKTLWDAMKA